MPENRLIPTMIHLQGQDSTITCEQRRGRHFVTCNFEVKLSKEEETEIIEIIENSISLAEKKLK